MQGLRDLEKAFDDITRDAKTSRLSRWDVVYAVSLALACLLSYAVMTGALARFVGRDADQLGGMWAVAATIFAFRAFGNVSSEAALDRLLATLVSFALQVCLNTGRDAARKQSFYRALADGLHARVGLRREDLVVSLVEVTKADRSFGNGEAQLVASRPSGSEGAGRTRGSS